MFPNTGRQNCWCNFLNLTFSLYLSNILISVLFTWLIHFYINHLNFVLYWPLFKFDQNGQFHRIGINITKNLQWFPTRMLSKFHGTKSSVFSEERSIHLLLRHGVSWSWGLTISLDIYSSFLGMLKKDRWG